MKRHSTLQPNSNTTKGQHKKQPLPHHQKGQYLQDNVMYQAPNELDLQMRFRKLKKELRTIFIALKYQFFKHWSRWFGTTKVPWIKLGVLAMLTYVVFKKDMQFQFNMKSPLNLFSGEQAGNINQNAKTAYAQTISWNDTGNPFAPASPEMLADKPTADYIKRFKNTAVGEMHKYGIPASIKMAQALIESRAGNSRLATQNNNHFGMKCFSKKCSKGHCTNFLDDHHKDFFRKYGSPWDSWRAHSLLLTGKRYKGLQKHGKDYEKWAVGLKAAGYATDKKYHTKLIAMIKKYKLYELDKL